MIGFINILPDFQIKKEELASISNDCELQISYKKLHVVTKELAWVCFGLVLWNINHCRLFNAKFIFMHINSSISNNSVSSKYSFFVYTPINVKTVLF